MSRVIIKYVQSRVILRIKGEIKINYKHFQNLISVHKILYDSDAPTTKNLYSKRKLNFFSLKILNNISIYIKAGKKSSC